MGNVAAFPRPERRHATPPGVVQRPLLAPRTIFVLTVAGAVVLRLWQVNALGFNSDEAVYAGQAAAIAKVPQLTAIFPIFRAHPLLFQFTLSLFYHLGASDLVARLLAVAFGLGAVYLTYRVGLELYGPQAGAISGLFMALMPYHVVVSRQALLDVPEVFFATLTLLAMVRYAITKRPIWLYATAGALGLTFLSKETAIVLLPAIYAFVALTPELGTRVKQVLISLGIFVLVILPFPLSIRLGGGADTSHSFLVWQLFRPANHVGSFYLTEVPRAMGYLLVLLAVGGLWMLRGRRARWRQRLLLVWILVPFAFFQLWPVKGFQYLLPLAPCVAILAARAVTFWPLRSGVKLLDTWIRAKEIRTAAIIVVAVSLLIPSWQAITTSNSSTFLAGSGGVPGGREAGLWLRENAPAGSHFLAIGPSMANILEFYGRIPGYRLSVSPNPLHRNPAYDPIINPDLSLRRGDIQYIVWDSFSAARSTFFEDSLERYIRRYRAYPVHREQVDEPSPTGFPVPVDVIIIYQVGPLKQGLTE